jgi:hypothetical protein
VIQSEAAGANRENPVTDAVHRSIAAPAPHPLLPMHPTLDHAVAHAIRLWMPLVR